MSNAADDGDIGALAHSLGAPPGAMIGNKYQVLEPIAAGGMGLVLRARHGVLEKDVAIKLMRPELAAVVEAAQRFLREARTAANIDSDYVARVLDLDLRQDGTPYIVMDFVEGASLGALIDEAPGTLDVALATDCVMQALAALEAAHAIGIVHRDLKPSNFILTRRANGHRRLKLLDFGVSKVVESGGEALQVAALTTKTAVLGSPEYMSPEQAKSSANCDARSDIWAVGVIAYELLTGISPFRAADPGASLVRVLTKTPAPLGSHRAGLPEGLEAAVQGCLVRDREARLQSARDAILAFAPFASARVRASIV